MRKAPAVRFLEGEGDLAGLRAALYRRVSTKEQAKPGHYSLDVQRQETRAYCHKWGLEIVREFEDVESGRKPQREGYQAILRLGYERKIDLILVTKIDRLGRNLMDSLESWTALTRAGVIEHAIDERLAFAPDPMMVLVNFWAADKEAQKTSQRVHASQEAKMKADPNWYYAELPFGWRVEHRDAAGTPILRPPGAGPEPGDHRTIVYDAREKHIVELMATWYLDGWSVKRIAQGLYERGLRPRSGGDWTTPSVSWMLHRTLNSGLVVWGETQNVRGTEPLRLPNRLPPLLPPETIDALKRRRELNRSPSLAGRARTGWFLLTGLLICGGCGTTLNGGSSPPDADHPKRWPFYQCRGYKEGLHTTVATRCTIRTCHRAERLEARVLDLLRDQLAASARGLDEPAPTPDRDFAAERQALLGERKSLDGSLQFWAGRVQREEIDDDQFQVITAGDKASRQRLEAQLRALEKDEAETAASAERRRDWPEKCQAFLADFAGMDRQAAKTELAALIARIEVAPDKSLRLFPRH
jgi:site-specific DNA recombinase